MMTSNHSPYLTVSEHHPEKNLQLWSILET